MNVSNQWKDIWWSYPSKMFPKLRNFANNLKPENANIYQVIFTNFFSVVHNYFLLWMFLIIERKYVDLIPAKCPQKLRKCAKKRKPENGNIYWTILQTFQCGSQLLFINVSIHWEDISWSYLSKMHPKTYKNYEKRKTWKCQYLLNHSINFSVWFTTTFYQCF